MMPILRRLAAFSTILVLLLAFPQTTVGESTDDPGNASDHAKGMPFRLGALPDTAANLRGVPYRVPFHEKSGMEGPATEATASASLPAAVDLSAGLPPVGSQGSQNSCVGWSIGYYYASYQEWREHGWATTSHDHQFSPSFIYNQINRGKDGGSSPSTAMNLLASKGVSTLDVFPYVVADYLSQPDANDLQAALPYTTSSWFYFSYGDVAGIKEHLAGGDPVSLTIPVYKNFYFPTSPCSTPIGVPTDLTLYGSHQITLVGYDDALGAFKIINSWGTTWGCGGYAWLTYDFVSEYGLYGYGMMPKDDTLGILAGVVRDGATGTAVAGAEVSAGGYAILTDANGEFALAVPEGSQNASVTAAGYTSWTTTTQLIGGVTTAIAPALSAGQASTGTVSGVVTNAADGAPIGGATVAVGALSTTTAADGGYTIAGVSAGNATLSVSASGYSPYSASIAISAGVTATADAALQPLFGSVSGIVTSAATGAGLSGATVSLGAVSRQTDGNGAFSFVGVAPGSYALQASAAGFEPFSTQITVTAGATTSVQPALTPTPAPTPTPETLVVKVIDAANGRPVSGAKVTVGDLSGMTDKKGNYTGQLLPGAYTVTVSKSRYQTATVQVTVAAATTIQVTLRK